MSWAIAGSQALLKLRGVALNDQWDKFTQFRIQREAERLYPHAQPVEAVVWPLAKAA